MSKECSQIPAKVIATCFALVAFVVALVLGYFAGNETSYVIKRAILAMLGCWLVGRLVGEIAQRAVQLRIDAYKREHPIPEDQNGAMGASQADQKQSDGDLNTSAGRGA